MDPKEEPIRVMCITWNIELQKPDQSEIDLALKKHAWRAGEEPDIIAIGIQEGDSKVDYGAVFNSSAPGYNRVSETGFSGITKAKQIITGHYASQELSILVRAEPKKDSEVKSTGVDNKHSRGREKGLCYAEVVIRGHKIGFVSMHAETNPDERPSDFSRILKILKSHGPFHAVFMMGDLNYRLKRQAGDKDKAKLEAEREELYRMMADRKLREELMERDSFEEKDTSSLPFLWPRFSTKCLPTYKRDKKPDKRKKYAELRKTDTYTYDPNSLKALYDIGICKKKGGPCWDFGWLDRIGYATFKNKTAAGTGLLTEGLMLGTDGVSLNGWNWVSGGDHVPVFCCFELEVVPKEK